MLLEKNQPSGQKDLPSGAGPELIGEGTARMNAGRLFTEPGTKNNKFKKQCNK